MQNSKIQKATEIRDAQIQFVSLVSKAANKKKFLVAKAEGRKRGTGLSTYGRILKADAETHFVTGIVYEPMTADADGHFMTEREIRKAAWWFARNGGKNDVQHNFTAARGLVVVESYIAPCALTIGGHRVVSGTWVMTVAVENREIWEAVQAGKITGFSMGGAGTYGTGDIPLPEKDLDSEEALTPETVQKMIDAAVEKVVAPVQKTHSRPSNLNEEYRPVVREVDPFEGFFG